MSSDTHPTDDSTELPDIEELTPARIRLLRIIGVFRGPTLIERPALRNDIEETDEDVVEEYIDDKSRILKTLNRCGLLNKLTDEVGYLERVRQGGGNPLVVDYEFEEERDTYSSTAYANSSQLATMAFDVLDRENEPSWKLDDVDMEDPNEIVTAVNRIVGRSVLGIQSESSQYRLVPEAVPIVEQELDGKFGQEIDTTSQ